MQTIVRIPCMSKPATAMIRLKEIVEALDEYHDLLMVLGHLESQDQHGLASPVRRAILRVEKAVGFEEVDNF